MAGEDASDAIVVDDFPAIVDAEAAHGSEPGEAATAALPDLVNRCAAGSLSDYSQPQCCFTGHSAVD